MNQNKKHDCTLLIRINKQVKNAYMDYCNENGYSISKRIRLLIEKDLNNKINSLGKI